MNLDRQCVPQCDPCGFNIEGLCEKFLCPEAKWRAGRGISCGMATHLIIRVEDTTKKRVGQQKTKRQKAVMK